MFFTLTRNVRMSRAVSRATGRNEAEPLSVRAGTLALYRHRNWRHSTLHQTVAVMSVIPARLLGIVGGQSDLEEAEEPDDPAAYSRSQYDILAERGPVRFVCTVTARMPVGDEVADLEVPTGTAVVVPGGSWSMLRATRWNLRR
jgi:hypothetical protein